LLSTSALLPYSSCLLRRVLVPTVRLELTRLTPLPPQDSVSTNSTTSALFRYLARLGAAVRCRSRRRLSRCALGLRDLGRFRRRLGLLVHHALLHQVPRSTAAAREISKPQARQEKDGRQDGRCARQEVRRPCRAEQAARRPAPERGAHVRTLAMLQQYKADERGRDQNMHRQQYRFPDHSCLPSPYPVSIRQLRSPNI